MTPHSSTMLSLPFSPAAATHIATMTITSMTKTKTKTTSRANTQQEAMSATHPLKSSIQPQPPTMVALYDIATAVATVTTRTTPTTTTTMTTSISLGGGDIWAAGEVSSVLDVTEGGGSE